VDIDLDVKSCCLSKIDEGAPGTALEQLGDVDPAAARRAMGIE
jgi:hypothetical protein